MRAPGAAQHPTLTAIEVKRSTILWVVRLNFHPVERTLAVFGRIDVPVNGAAMLQDLSIGPFWGLPLDEWRRAIDVNITVDALLPGTTKTDFGRTDPAARCSQSTLNQACGEFTRGGHYNQRSRPAVAYRGAAQASWRRA